MHKSSFLQEISVSFLVRILGAFSGLIMTLAITRNLSVPESGVFFLVFSLCSVLALLCTLGLNTTLIKLVAGYSSEESWGIIAGVVVVGLKAVAVVSSCVALIVYFSRDFIGISLFSQPLTVSALKVLSIMIPLFTINTLISYAFLGLRKTLSSVLLQNIVSQVLVICFLYFISALGIPLSLHYVSQVVVLSVGLTCFFSLYLWFRQDDLKVPIDISRTGELAACAKSMWLAMVMGIFVQWSGQLIVGGFVSATELAHFAVALRASILISFVLIAVNLVAAPHFSAIAKMDQKQELREITLLCGRLCFFIGTPIFILMMMAPHLILDLFGSSYRDASLVFRILIVGQFINLCTGSVGFLLNMTGYEKDMRNIIFFAGSLCLMLNLTLIPFYGIVGAAVATATGFATQNLLAAFMVKKRLGINTINIFTK